MIGKHLSTASMRLLLAFLLVAIGLQAVPSGDLPLGRDNGSAFSASSVESAVARQAEPVVTAVPGPQVLPPPDFAETASRAALARDPDWRLAVAADWSPFAIDAPPYLPRPPPAA